MAEFEPADKDSTLMAAIAAFFGNFIAIVIYLLKPSDRFVKFYALQTIVADIALVAAIIVLYGLMFVGMLAGMAGSVLGGVGSVIGILSFIPMLCVGLALLLYVIFRLYSTYMAFSGNVFKIPVIGNFVAKYV